MVTISQAVYSQGEGKNWFFGAYAGVSWCTGVPVPQLMGQLTTNEGCATISDPQCNLLFYTDGITVWNSLHIPMPNSLASSPGGALDGDPSSTQSGVIVPKPLNPDIYYIFTVDNNIGANGCKYSVVDMTLMGGYGDVVPGQKNIMLFTPSSEKISAVNHSNGYDIWVITHPWNSGSFWTYLVSASGVSAVPIVSTTGSYYGGGSDVTRGYLKPSPDGAYIVAGIEGLDKYEIFQFNNTTGVLSMILSMPASYNSAYGVEFSPDGSKLYGSERWGTPVFQWDMSNPTPPAIMASQTQIATLSTANGGALQLAPDNKIYLARNNQGYLGVINFPNTTGVACNYVDQGLFLGGKQSKEGLPTFITSYFNIADFTFLFQCEGDSTSFNISNTYMLDSAYWNFGDPASGINNTSTDLMPIHQFSTADTFDVTLVTYRQGIGDTITLPVEIYAYPIIPIPSDTVICLGAHLELNAGSIGDTYFWSTGETTQEISTTPFDTLTYWVQVVNHGCPSVDSTTVYPFQITSDFIISPVICANDYITVTYTGNADPTANFIWNFNSGNIVSGVGQGPYELNWWNPGSYNISLTVEQGTCVANTNTQNVVNPPGLTVQITGNDVPCHGDATGEIFVSASGGDGQYTYLWNNGTNTQNQLGVPAGNYQVVITYNQICTDTALYELNEPPDIVEAIVTENDIKCNGETSGFATVQGTGGVGPYTYLWNENDQTSSTINNLGAGFYMVTVTDSHGCTAMEGALIDEPPPLQVYGTPDQFICEGESASISASADGGASPYTFQWDNLGIGSSFVVSPGTTTIYEVSATDSLGCSAGPAFAIVNVYPPVESFPYAFNDTICPGDTTAVFASFSGGNGGPYLVFDGDSNALELPLIVSPSTTTSYAIQGYDNCGSPSNPNEVTIFVMDVPDVQFSNNVDFGCEDLEVEFNAVGANENDQYKWAFFGIGDPAYEEDHTTIHVFEEPGIYDVMLEIKNQYGCKNSLRKDKLIHVYGRPEMNFVYSPTIVPVSKALVFFENLGMNFDQSIWFFGDGISEINDQKTLSHLYSDTGSFNVILQGDRFYQHQTQSESIDLTCSDTVRQSIVVYEENTLYIPNAFNPESEFSDNAVFKPSIFGSKFTDYHLLIYDRWGEKVFETFNAEHGWDGKIKNGVTGKPGVYTWIIDFIDAQGQHQYKSGIVTLVR